MRVSFSYPITNENIQSCNLMANIKIEENPMTEMKFTLPSESMLFPDSTTQENNKKTPTLALLLLKHP